MLRFRLRDRQKGSGWRSKRGTQSAAVTRPTTPESVGVGKFFSVINDGLIVCLRAKAILFFFVSSPFVIVQQRAHPCDRRAPCLPAGPPTPLRGEILKHQKFCQCLLVLFQIVSKSLIILFKGGATTVALQLVWSYFNSYCKHLYH